MGPGLPLVARSTGSGSATPFDRLRVGDTAAAWRAPVFLFAFFESPRPPRQNEVTEEERIPR